MPGESGRSRDREARKAERAIVLQLLSDARAERWSVAELTAEISGFEAAVVEGALRRLTRERVLHRDGSHVWASRAARRLDALELVGI